jgi:hypothetical protein
MAGSEPQSWLTLGGTVALRANDAEPASIGAEAERQSAGGHVFTMHLTTRFSAHLMLLDGWRGSTQQCPGGQLPGLKMAMPDAQYMAVPKVPEKPCAPVVGRTL